MLKLLETDEPYWRQQAKRVLKERGKEEVLPQLAKFSQGNFADERVKLELLWVYQSLNVVNEALLGELLVSTDHRIRAAATRVVYHWQDRVGDKFAHLTRSARDSHPRVRMEATHALRRAKERNATVAALATADQPTDRFLRYAMEQTADMTKSAWLPALRAGTLDFGKNTSGLLLALQVADTADAVPLLLKSADSWNTDPDATREVMSMVASRGDSSALRDVFRYANDSQASIEVRAALLDALRDAALKRKLKPAGDLSGLTPLLHSEHPALRVAAAELTGAWGMTDQAEALSVLAQGSNQPSRVREAALRGLSSLADGHRLTQLIASGENNQIRIAATAALVPVDLQQAADAAGDLFPQLGEQDAAERLVSAFLSQKQGETELATRLNQLAAAGQKISPDVAKLCVRRVRSSGRDDVEPLVQSLLAAGGLTGEAKTLTPNQRRQLLADATQQGDPVRGEVVYRRQELNCVKCHAIGGAGGLVGPDLASIGASAPADYVLESLLDPNAKIKENYHSLVVVDENGQVVTGVKLRQTDESLILRDAEDNVISVQLDAIIDQKDGGSLMPSGLLNNLTRQETLDLVRFMTELGKIGDFALPREAYVRTWQTPILKGNTNADINGKLRKALAKLTEAQLAADATGDQWAPAYSTVAGVLPLTEVAALTIAGAPKPIRFVRFQVDVEGGEPTSKTYVLQRHNGVRAYVDGKAVGLKDGLLQTTLSPGTHSITLAIDSIDSTTPFRIQERE